MAIEENLRKELKRINKINKKLQAKNVKESKGNKVVVRTLLKKEPRQTIRLTAVENRTPYFKQQWESEKRSLLSWK